MSNDTAIDVAIVGAGAAGTYLADRLAGARPEWSIRLFERSSRVGGRLRSVGVEGLAHPIELGGMRYLTSTVRWGRSGRSFAVASPAGRAILGRAPGTSFPLGNVIVPRST